MLLKLIVLVSVVTMTSCVPVKEDAAPFKTEESFMLIKGNSPMQSGDLFDYTLVLETTQPMHNVIIKVELPKEVNVERVNLSTFSDNPFKRLDERLVKTDANMKEIVWKGELVPDEKSELLFSKSFTKKLQQMRLLLISQTDGKKWSAPIRGSIEFDYDPQPKMQMGGYVDVKAGHYTRSFSATYEKWMPKGRLRGD